MPFVYSHCSVLQRDSMFLNHEAITCKKHSSYNIDSNNKTIYIEYTSFSAQRCMPISRSILEDWLSKAVNGHYDSRFRYYENLDALKSVLEFLHNAPLVNTAGSEDFRLLIKSSDKSIYFCVALDGSIQTNHGLCRLNDANFKQLISELNVLYKDLTIKSNIPIR